MNSPERILDANSNRAREAMRVLEESARFLLSDPRIARELKQMRHDFAQTIAAVPSLIHHRDTPGDVGTQIATASEGQRQSMRDVVAAAGSRLSEALRVIEEYGKLIGHVQGATELASTAERLRYRGYDLTQQLLASFGSGRRVQWRLCLLLTESLCAHHRWQDVLDQALGQGVDAVQVREKQMDGGELLDRVREVIEVCAGRAAVIVNDRPDIARLSDADGVHLGQSDLSPADARKIVGERCLIGVSTANLDQAQRAAEQGADYCGVGPMFTSKTKHKPHLAGPDYLRAYREWDGLPHLAIGGITPDNINALVNAGCLGVAVSSAICSAEDPAASSRALVQALGG